METKSISIIQKQILLLAIAYTCFVIYGSLVPCQFTGLPLEDALNRFQRLPFLNLGIDSRADWVANVLLFVPQAFLWLGRLSLQKSLNTKIIATISVLLGSFLLCTAIEFAQLFFPPRTVSLNDLYAESLGAIIGVTAWWLGGDKFSAWLLRWHYQKTNADIYLQAYLAGLFFYNIMPLDLTLSPSDFYHKWKEGRIVLIPFGGLKGDFFHDVYDTFTDIILWLPLPLLWLKQKQMNIRQLLIRVFLSALIVEIFQLFVFSRVTDMTDILLAVIGGAVGISLIKVAANPSIYKSHQSINHFFLYAIFAYFLWTLILYAVFWYPYDFKWDYDLSSWSSHFFTVPFNAYYYGSEYRAITELFHKTLFFAPLGLIIGFVFKPIINRRRAGLLAILIISISALSLEGGQLFLPQKNSDITDFILEVFGGQLGFLISQQWINDSNISGNLQITKPLPLAISTELTFKQIRFTQPSPQSHKQPSILLIYKAGWLLGIGGFAIMCGGLIWASHTDSVPYNVRELFSENAPVISGLGISLLIYWCFSYPLLFLLSLLNNKRQWYNRFYVQAIPLHALGAWILTRAFLPLESIHDIVGSPILNIPEECEIALRFVALFSIFSLMSLGTIHSIILIVTNHNELKRLFFVGAIEALFLLPLCYGIIVVAAATDNLTELMADSGFSFRVINLCLYLILFNGLGTLTAVAIVFKKIKYGLIAATILLVSPAVGYQLLEWGTENTILKYGSVFSALQFLLSPDRQHLSPDAVLRTRFTALHFCLVCMVVLTQTPLLMIYYDQLKQLSHRPIIQESKLSPFR